LFSACCSALKLIFKTQHSEQAGPATHASRSPGSNGGPVPCMHARAHAPLHKLDCRLALVNYIDLVAEEEGPGAALRGHVEGAAGDADAVCEGVAGGVGGCEGAQVEGGGHGGHGGGGAQLLQLVPQLGGVLQGQ
jgi:hypothetical protein